MSRLLSVLFFLLTLAACENRGPVKALQQQTEAIHDEAMKDLGELNRTQKGLKEALIGPDSASVRRPEIEQALAEMEKAHEEMFAWMAQYEKPDNKPAAEALDYLEGQKKAISDNHQAIRAATERGKKLLGQ